MELIIRAERKEDYSGITEVTDLAFRQKNEGRLIVGLRRNRDFIPELSLVAEIGNEIIGHIFFSDKDYLGRCRGPITGIGADVSSS